MKFFVRGDCFHLSWRAEYGACVGSRPELRVLALEVSIRGGAVGKENRRERRQSRAACQRA